SNWGATMCHRIALLTATFFAISQAAWALDFDFQDNVTALHYSDAVYNGPGVVPSSHPWTAFFDPGTFTNDGVTLTLSGFDTIAIPEFVVSGPAPYHGTPAFTLSQAMAAHGYATFQLSNIPAAPAGDTYEL